MALSEVFLLSISNEKFPGNLFRIQDFGIGQNQNNHHHDAAVLDVVLVALGVLETGRVRVRELVDQGDGGGSGRHADAHGRSPRAVVASLGTDPPRRHVSFGRGVVNGARRARGACRQAPPPALAPTSPQKGRGRSSGCSGTAPALPCALRWPGPASRRRASPSWLW